MIVCDFCKKDITQEGRHTIRNEDDADEREFDACTRCSEQWNLHQVNIRKHTEKYEIEQKAKWIKDNLAR